MHSTCSLIDSACWLYVQYMLINRQCMLTVFTRRYLTIQNSWPVWHTFFLGYRIVHYMNWKCIRKICLAEVWLIDSSCWLYAQYMLINRECQLTVYAVPVDCMYSTCWLIHSSCWYCMFLKLIQIFINHSSLVANMYCLLMNMYCVYSQLALPINQHVLCIQSTWTVY
jgi:hypothetical protein